MNVGAFTSLMDTDVIPTNPVPVMTMLLPAAPLPGVKLVITGGGWTVKSLLEVAVPAGVVTDIFPVVAPAGTTAVICVAELTV